MSGTEDIGESLSRLTLAPDASKENTGGQTPKSEKKNKRQRSKKQGPQQAGPGAVNTIDGVKHGSPERKVTHTDNPQKNTAEVGPSKQQNGHSSNSDQGKPQRQKRKPRKKSSVTNDVKPEGGVQTQGAADGAASNGETDGKKKKGKKNKNPQNQDDVIVMQALLKSALGIYESKVKDSPEPAGGQTKLSSSSSREGTPVRDATPGNRNRPPAKDKAPLKVFGETLSPEINRLLEDNCIYPLKKKSVRFPTARYFCRLCDYHCDTGDVCQKHIKDNRHQRLKKIQATNYLLRSLPAPTDSHTQALDDLVQQVFKDHGLTETDVQRRNTDLKALEEVVQKKMPKIKLHMYGSSLNGMGLKSSDINIDIQSPESPAKTLVDIFELLKADNSGCYQEVQSNFSAKVPTVIFRLGPSRLRCEVTAGNQSSIDTSRLLAAYSSIDHRVKILGVAFRQWAKLCQVDQQEAGTLPPYVFGLMTVYFLQQCQNAVLPVLHEIPPLDAKERKAAYFADIDNLKSVWETSNKDSVGLLWLKMLRFYAHEFDVPKLILCVRQAEPMKRSVKNWSTKRLAIEDPFNPKRNVARCVSHHHVHEYIYDRIRAGYLYFGIPQTKDGPLFDEGNIKVFEKMLTRDMKRLDSLSDDKNVDSDSSPDHVTNSEKQSSSPTKKERPEKQTNSPAKREQVEKHTSSPAKREQVEKLTSSPKKKEKAEKQKNSPAKREQVEKQTSSPAKREQVENQIDSSTKHDPVAVKNKGNCADKPPDSEVSTSNGPLAASEQPTGHEHLDSLVGSIVDDILRTAVGSVHDKGKSGVEVTQTNEDKPPGATLDQQCSVSEAVSSGQCPDEQLPGKTDTDSCEKKSDTDVEMEIEQGLQEKAQNVTDDQKSAEIVTDSKAGTEDAADSADGEWETDEEEADEEMEKDTEADKEKHLNQSPANKEVEVHDDDEEEENVSPERTAAVLESFGLTPKEKKIQLSESTINLLDDNLKQKLEALQQGDFLFQFCKDTLSDGKGPAVMCSLCQKEGHLKKNCPEENLPPLEPLPPMSENFIKCVDQVLVQVHKDFEPSPRELQMRKEILQELQQFIKDIYPDANLSLFGSSQNGFGFQHSDLDICMTFDSHPTTEGLDLVEIIENLSRRLKKHKGLYNVIPITTAKVPIVKFVHRRSQLEGDISLYNTLAMHNTQMLRLYAQLDYRVRVLGYVMKVFAKVCDICDASRGSLSSYAYILMVLYYLQQRRPPVIPVLQELYVGQRPERIVDGWNAWYLDDYKQVSKHWPFFGNNKESVAELWLGLLRFYTESFNFKDHVVSIRQHKPLTRFEKLWNGNCIAIEDPFDLSHNLGGGLSRKMNTFIIKAFRKGRLVFGTPLNQIPRMYKSLLDCLFDPRVLTEGDPPNDRGCRVCGKIGHFVKECPVIQNRKDRRERERERREFSKKDDDRQPKPEPVTPVSKSRTVSGETDPPKRPQPKPRYQRSKSDGHQDTPVNNLPKPAPQVFYNSRMPQSGPQPGSRPSRPLLAQPNRPGQGPPNMGPPAVKPLMQEPIPAHRMHQPQGLLPHPQTNPQHHPQHQQQAGNYHRENLQQYHQQQPLGRLPQGGQQHSQQQYFQDPAILQAQVQKPMHQHSGKGNRSIKQGKASQQLEVTIPNEFYKGRNPDTELRPPHRDSSGRVRGPPPGGAAGYHRQTQQMYHPYAR